MSKFSKTIQEMRTAVDNIERNNANLEGPDARDESTYELSYTVRIMMEDSVEEIERHNALEEERQKRLKGVAE